MQIKLLSLLRKNTNSSAHGRCGSNVKERMLRIKFMSTFCETSHQLSQC